MKPGPNDVKLAILIAGDELHELKRFTIDIVEAFEHGVVRAARDLVHTAAQLGLLSGDGPVKTFSAIPVSDDVLLFYVQMIADLEGSTAKSSRKRSLADFFGAPPARPPS